MQLRSRQTRGVAPQIYLLTGPVQSGKTTRLREWCARLGAPVLPGPDNTGSVPPQAGAPRVDGILAPVIDGRRHLLHIASGEMRDLEDLSAGAPAVTVRRFTFNADAFAWARERLLEATARWIVVDEVGPLELRGAGLEPAVSAVVAGPAPNVVLVIREELVKRALAHLGVDAALPFRTGGAAS